MWRIPDRWNRPRSASRAITLALLAALAVSISACAETPGVNAPVRVEINASADVNAFKPTMRGVAMNNWNWIWSGITEPDSPRRAALIEATKLLDPGVVRFGGGLWANSVGWDRANTAPEDGAWTFTDSATGQSFDYRHAYKPAMIDSYADFARQVGAETIMQVNVCDNNPAMWADFLRFTNIERGYGFRYWELGNEIDLNGCIEPGEYARRFVEYRAALKSVDPSIEVLGPSMSMPSRTEWIDALTDVALDEIDVLSFHWYQLTEWSEAAESFDYQGGSPESLLSYNRGTGTECQRGFACPGELMSLSRLNRITYRRALADAAGSEIIAPLRESRPGLPVAITEMGPHATLHESPVNGNHIAAVWLADMLGRWAYNGVDILTYYSLEDGNTGIGNTRGLLGVDGPDSLDVRPIFLTEWLYAAHFGDTLVESSSDHWDQGVTAWASRDTSDPDVLQVILVNLTGETEEVTLSVNGFAPTTGEAYVVSSDDPLSLDDPASFASHSTTVNGVAIPDVLLDDPEILARTLEGITPGQLNVAPQFEYAIEPYSIVALTLRR